MAGKRSATTELNHENWNEENEPEEAGTFTKASDDELQKRVVRVARRRLPPKDGQSQSAFGAFTGFKTAATTSASPFSCLASKIATTNTTSSLDTSTKTSTNVAKPTTTANNNPQNGAKKAEEASGAPALSSVPNNKKEQKDDKASKKSNEYFAKLKGLNESVTQWIKTHVDENPFCILTPIFRDYEKYLKDIQAKHGNETDNAPPEHTASNTDSNKASASTEKQSDSLPFGEPKTNSVTTSLWTSEKSIFGNVSNTESVFASTEQTTAMPTFESSKSVFNSPEQTTDAPKSIFGGVDKNSTRSAFGSPSPHKNPFLSKSPGTSESKPEENETKSEKKPTSSSFTSPSANSNIFSFGQTSTSPNATAGFIFGSTKRFSFGAQAVKPQESDNSANNEAKDDDYIPPEPDFKPVKEEGAIYDKRCKVFLKKGANYTVKGVGTLFLKPTENDKTQLIVRADTAMGSVILNTLLTESTPIVRMNKNSVIIACVSSTESSPHPSTVLLRVKTEEDADCLVEALNKYKK